MSVRPVGTAPVEHADVELGDHARALYAEQSCECCTSYGRMHLICGPRAACFPAQLFVGPDWPCMCITLALISGLSYLWLENVARRLHPAIFVIGIVSAAVTGVAYLYAACSDPGLIFKTPQNDAMRNVSGPKGWRKCGQCQIWRPPGASHCYDCDMCIMELDHHCPWTGKCIGQRTLQMFYVFTSTLCLHIIFVAITTLLFFVGK